MDLDHAEKILQALADWYSQSHSGPEDCSQIMDDDRSLQEHILSALSGISMDVMSKL